MLRNTTRRVGYVPIGINIVRELKARFSNFAQNSDTNDRNDLHLISRITTLYLHGIDESQGYHINTSKKDAAGNFEYGQAKRERTRKEKGKEGKQVSNVK